jgi:small subunit ribosomal protein S17
MSEQVKITRSVAGLVVSDKMDKTVTVLVERKVRHPVYKKYVRRSTKYHVHDENNEARIGDTVQIAECRPISKSKAWRLVEIISRAN